MSVASTSALSALLSSLNNGSSGLNVAQAVNDVIQADAAPEQVWESDQSTLSSQSSEIQQLESEAANLTSSLQQLSDPGGAFGSVTATSSNSAAVTASAASGATAGNFTAEVTQLASTASWYSEEETSATTTLPTGSFTIQQGSSQQTFNTGSGNTGDNLTDLAAAINSSGLGVTASVVTDHTGSRLSIVSQTQGQAGNFTVTNATGMTFTNAAPGQDAIVKVNGVPVDSATNTVVDAVPGVTLNVQQLNVGSPATISVAPDTGSIDSAVSSFVSDYNALVSDLNHQFTFNTSSGAEGVLASDSAARSMQNDVLAAANLNIGSGAYQTLASLGITTSNTGTLTLNTDTLNSALSSDFSGVTSFFQGNANGNPPVTGFASTVLSTLDSYTDPVNGAFTVDLSSISSENADLQNQINTFELYLENQQSVLTTEYNNANIALQQLPNEIKQTQAILGENSSGSNS